MLLKIAFRNLFRHRRRSILTGLTMVGGFVLLSLALSIADGSYDTAIDTFTRSYTGHVQIHHQGYLDRPTLYNTFSRALEIGDRLQSLKGVRAWTPRVYSGALAFIGKKTMVARIIGIDPVREPKTTLILPKIAQGRFLSTTAAREVMIGSNLAEALRAGPGDELVLISQGADGSIANDIFKIVAVLKGGTSALDGNQCYLHLQTAQDFLALQGRCHEIAVILDDFSQSRKYARKISGLLEDPDLEVSPWETVEKQFYRSMMADKEGNWITLMIIVAIVGIGVLNTVLMSILERTQEYGLLKAMGTRPGAIFWLIVLETGALAGLAVMIAAVISLGANYALSRHGLTLPQPVNVGGFMISTFYGSTKLREILLPAGVTLITAVLASAIPAVHAVRLRAVQALKR